MRLVSQAAAGVGHDFNNLLAVVLGSLQHLEMRVDDPASLQLIDRAQEGAQRGSLLVQQLLSFSGQATLIPSVVQIDLLALEPLLHSSVSNTVLLDMQQGGLLWHTKATSRNCTTRS